MCPKNWIAIRHFSIAVHFPGLNKYLKYISIWTCSLSNPYIFSYHIHEKWDSAWCFSIKNMFPILLISAHGKIPCNWVSKYRVHLAIQQNHCPYIALLKHVKVKQILCTLDVPTLIQNNEIIEIEIPSLGQLNETIGLMIVKLTECLSLIGP